VLLPLVWTLFVVLAVISFGMVAAYWLDVQDRSDLSLRRRIGYSLATILFPVTIPVYVLAGRAGWPRPLRLGAFVPLLALGLFCAFLFGLIR
jgi:Ca2+/H+ antiporter